MVKKRIPKATNIQEPSPAAVEAFAAGAEGELVKPIKKAPSKAVYKRYTFSLTAEVSTQIDSLTLKSRTVKANRSDVVKAGTALLNKLSEQEFSKLLKSIT